MLRDGLEQLSLELSIYSSTLNVYGSYDGLTGVNSINRYIPSGQSFFVKATAASPLLSLTETVKVSNTSPILLKTGNELNTLNLNSINKSKLIGWLSALHI